MSSSFGCNGRGELSVIARIRQFFISDGEGGALVELAISLPILLIFLTGIFSFSIALYQKLQLAEGVSTAGRMLAVDRGAANPCLDATNALYSAAPGLTQSKISVTYTLNGVVTNGTTCNSSATNGNPNMVAGANAQIQATYSGCMLNVVNIWGGNMIGSCSLYSQVTEIVQ